MVTARIVLERKERQYEVLKAARYWYIFYLGKKVVSYSIWLVAELEAGCVGGEVTECQLCCSTAVEPGAWSHVNTLTGSQSGGGGHSLLSPLSLHHKTSPPHYGQHVSELCLYGFAVILLFISRTQLTATNRPSPSYTLWSDNGPIIENWTKWRLYLQHPSGDQTIVYSQSFVQLKLEVT